MLQIEFVESHYSILAFITYNSKFLIQFLIYDDHLGLIPNVYISISFFSCSSFDRDFKRKTFLSELFLKDISSGWDIRPE